MPWWVLTAAVWRPRLPRRIAVANSEIGAQPILAYLDNCLRNFRSLLIVAGETLPKNRTVTFYRIRVSQKKTLCFTIVVELFDHKSIRIIFKKNLLPENDRFF